MSHEYVRTYLQRARSIQREVAIQARLSTSDSRAFDEGEIYSDLSDHILRHGLDTEAVVQEVLSFTLSLAKGRAGLATHSTVPSGPHVANDEQDVAPSNSSSSSSGDESGG